MTALALTALVFSFVVWRVTRFLLRDSLIDGTRFKVEHYFGSRSNRTSMRKMSELVTCPWCVSVWVAAVLTAVWRLTEGDGIGWFWTAIVWLAAAAGAMACWATWEDDE